MIAKALRIYYLYVECIIMLKRVIFFACECMYIEKFRLFVYIMELLELYS